MPELRDVLKSGDIDEIWSNIYKMEDYVAVNFDGANVKLDTLGVMTVGTASVTTVFMIAGENLLLGDCVIAQNDQAFKANNNDLIHANIVTGIVVADAALGAQVEVVTDGVFINPAWAWVPGPVFVDVGGLMTQTAPLPPAAVFLQKVGTAASATELSVDFDRPVLLVEELLP